MYAIAFDLDTDMLKNTYRDIRMLRIEDENDLKPVINRTLKQRKSL